MRQFYFTLTLTFLLSCGTENHYFKKSLTKDERHFLTKYDTLVKDFSGKTNWYKQYWTGKVLIIKKKKSYEFEQIGQWRQTSKDRTELYTITNFDNQGYLVDQQILGYDGTPEVETTYKKDTLNNKVVLKCEGVWRYADTKTIRLKSQSLIIDEKSYRHGTWSYYLKTGELEKTEKYRMNKKVE